MTTDHGSNIVAALKNGIRLDCLCHRLHTVIDSAWKDTCQDVAEVAAYEAAISDLCRFAKQSTGVQEQLPKSLNMEETLIRGYPCSDGLNLWKPAMTPW